VARIRALLESPEIQVTHEADLDRLLVERYIPGAEVAVEGLLSRGKLRILGIFDKPDPLEGPYFEETIYVTPSRLPDEMQERIGGLRGVDGSSVGLGTRTRTRRIPRERTGAVGAGSGTETDWRFVFARVAIWAEACLARRIARSAMHWKWTEAISTARRKRRV